jgi:PAS domain S-box-containing protein
MQSLTPPLIPIEEHFKIMADTAPVLIWMANADNHCYYFNAGWLQFTGRTMEEEHGAGWIEGLHPDDVQQCMDTYLDAFASQKGFKMEYRLRRHDGVYRWLLNHGVPSYTSDGTFTGFIGSCMDIEDVLESERQKNDVLNAASLQREQTLNEELFATNEELSATNEELAASNEELAAINEELQQTQETLALLNDELESTVALRTKALAESESRARSLSEDLLVINEEMMVANKDLIVANEALSLSQENLRYTVDQLAISEYKTRSIVENAPFPIGVYVGREMRIELTNQAILDVWGKGNDVVGKCYAEVLPELSEQNIYAQLDRVFTTGKSFHARNQRVDLIVGGVLKTFFFNYSFTALRNKAGDIYGVMNTAADVTDVVSAKQAIEESEERFRTMAEDTDVLIATAADSGSATYFNKAWQDITGKSVDELQHYGWLDLVHPDDKDSFLETYLTAYKKQESFSGEFRILSKNGDYRWLYARVPARHRSDGSFAGYISSCVDITDLKKDEVRKNDFIGMVSHELKTPLTALNGLVQVASSKLKHSDDTFMKAAMDKATVQVKKMGTMINGFLNISRLESGKIMIDKSRFNLRELIAEIIAEAELTASTHRIHFVPGDPVYVIADEDKIGSVISNLLSNAIKYSPKGDFVELKCEISGNTAQVSVRDEGMGMLQQDAEKIFERYYRVEGAHTRNISGFGIGLYLSAEIIERHDGKIWVESESGKGSTFHFSLPLDLPQSI